jgi:hypothetical protein
MGGASVFVTGIDPGKTVGWATLWLDPATRPRLVDCGEWTHDEAVRAAASGVLREHLVGVERAVGFYASKARSDTEGPALASIARDLLDAAYLAGELRGLLRAAGGRAEYVQVADAYRAIGIKMGAQRGKALAGTTVAKQTAAALLMAVDGWPKTSSQHKRDAAIDALYVARTTGPSPTDTYHKSPSPGVAAPPPGTYGPGDYGPDSFGGSDYP